MGPSIRRQILQWDTRGSLIHFCIASEDLLGSLISSTGCPQKMYYICFVHRFYSFLHNQLRPTSKDSQFHGYLLTLPIESVARSWLPLCMSRARSVCISLAHHIARRLALLGQAFGWVNRTNCNKDRLFASSQGFRCPLVHNTLQVPHKKSPEG